MSSCYIRNSTLKWKQTFFRCDKAFADLCLYNILFLFFNIVQHTDINLIAQSILYNLKNVEFFERIRHYHKILFEFLTISRNKNE